MKKKILALIAGFALSLGAVSAQTGAASGTQFGVGEDSLKCITNISLFVPYAKNGNYKDALEYWEKAFNDCPASTRDLYLYGVRIVAWQIQNEKDQAKKDALIEKLLGVYDQRIKYFGNDNRYPESWILGRKALDLLTHKPDAVAKAYEIIKRSVELGKEESEIPVLQYYITLSSLILSSNEGHKEQFINDYLKTSAILDNIVAKGDKAGEQAAAAKVVCDERFATSGAADCESIQRIFGPKIEQNKDNKDFLKETIALIRRVGCQEIDCYFTAAAYAHKIEPTTESALGMAGQALRQGDVEVSMRYFEEAVSLAEVGEKAEIYYNMGTVMFSQRNYYKSKEYLTKAIDAAPNDGKTYIMLARLYAASPRAIYPDDPTMAASVYYAVVDKLQKAKSVDPSVTDEANQLIRTYSQHFPKKEEIFMNPDIEVGKPLRIGGWVQETVVPR